MTKLDLRIAVVTLAPFPFGNVSTMRYFSYLKALSLNGAFSYVLIYCPTRMAAHIKERSGVYDGVYYQYSTEITWKRYSSFNKIYYVLKGLFNSVRYLTKNRIQTIILYGDNPFFVNLFYRIFCTFTRKRYIGDRSELPTIDERNSKLKMLVYGMKQRMFDGMIVMTKQLKTFYQQYSNNDNFLFFLPMTVAPSRFDGLKKNTVEPPYIAVVFGRHNRDGLYESLQSFDLYRRKGGTFDLYLIGDYDNMPNKLDLDKLIDSSDYKNNIRVLGKQPNDRVPFLLYNASILLTTPNTYISGGFPTKLGEYMLSEVPIVATKAGELLDYIIPEEDMLMCFPGDIDEISNSLLRIEQNPSLANTLSINAKKKAKRLFCADSYIVQLSAFLAN